MGKLKSHNQAEVNSALHEAQRDRVFIENKLHAFLANSEYGAVILTEEGKLIFGSPSLEGILGYSTDEAKELDMFGLVHPDDSGIMAGSWEQVMANPGVPIKGHSARIRHKDGTWRWLEAELTNMLSDPSINGIIDYFRDVTDRKEVEDKLLQANRLHAFLSQIKKTIMHFGNEQIIFKEACKVSIEIGLFKAAWIGIFDEKENQINIVEQCGSLPGDKILFKCAACEIEGAQQWVLRTGNYVVNNDLQNEPESKKCTSWAGERRILSSIILPIKKAGAVIGTFNLCSTDLNFFDAGEIAFLEEAVEDISFALDVFESEKQKRQAEENLKNKELRLNQIQALAHVGSWELDFLTGIGRWSVETLRIYGIPEGKTEQTFESWLSYIHPDDLDTVMEAMQKGRATMEDWGFLHRIVKRDGTVKHLYSQSYFQFDKDGKPVGLYGITHDLTEIKDAQEALKESDHTLRDLVEFNKMLIDGAPIGISSYDAITGNCVSVNGTFQKITGGSSEELVKQNFRNIPSWKGSGLLEDAEETLRTGKVSQNEILLTSTFGNRKWVLYRFSRFFNKGKPQLLLLLSDSSERKLAEEKLVHANRLYAFLSHINQTIVHVGDDKTLFKEACRIAVDIGTFKAACIGIFDEEHTHVNLVEEVGIPSEDLALFKNVYYETDGPQDRVLKSGTYAVYNNIQKELKLENWKSYAKKRGFRSFIVLPIKKSGKVIGTFNLYSTEADFFDYKEIELLDEAARDISFALDVFEKDRIRAEVEKNLQYKEFRLNQAQEIAHLGSWEVDFFTGKSVWSDESCRIYGIPLEENEQTFESFLGFIHPEDLDEVMGIIDASQVSWDMVELNFRILRKDGTVRRLYQQSHYVFNEAGQPVGIHGIAHDITERMEAEDELKRSEFQYRQIVETAQEGIWLADENFITTFVNKKMCEMIGFSSEEMLGRPMFHFLDGSVEQREAASLGERKIGVTRYENMAFITKSGKPILTNLSANTIFDEDGTYCGSLAMISDVTEKKKLEDLLDKTNRMSGIGNWEVDLQNETVYWSDVMREILEVDHEFVPDLTTTNAYYYEGESSILINQKVRELIEKGIPYDEESQIVTQKGNVKWVRTIGEGEFFDGACQRIYGSFQDIDTRKKAQIEVLKGYEERNIILESIADGFYAVDKDWVVTYWNKEAENILGKKRKDIEGKNLWNQYPEVVDTAVYNYFQKSVKENKVQHFQYFFIPMKMWTEISAYPSSNGLSVFFRDVSERKLTEMKLKEMNQNLEAFTKELIISNKNLEQFSYIVSHNLRTPVANIIGLSKALNDESLAEEQKNIFKNELNSSVLVLDEVILDLNHILEMKQEMHEKKEMVFFTKLVENIEQSISGLIQSENVEIITDFSAAGNFMTVRGYFHSIFYNLIINSIQYREPGRSPVIEIKTEKKEDRIVLTFTDNGSGMDLEKNGEQIFGLYKRFHPNVESKGLGLFMVKSQIEALGGKISCKSKPHQGTKFKIELKMGDNSPPNE